MGARYYGGNNGKFISQDRASLDLGSPDWESTYDRPQELFLRDPQQLNTYSYARNNPLLVTDPGGDIIPIVLGIVYAGLTIHDAYNTAKTLTDPNASAGSQVMAVALFASPLGEVKAAGNIIDEAYKRTNKAGRTLLDGVESKDVRNYVADNYRSKSVVGSGSTADAVRYTAKTGKSVGGGKGDHLQKAQDQINRANNIIKKMGPTLTAKDKEVLNKVKKDLENVLKSLKKK